MCSSCNHNVEESWCHLMKYDGYRDKWHDIYENNSNTNIMDIVNKMMGCSSTSPEFITFREFAIEAKFLKLTFAHLHNCRNISTSQVYLLSGKILLEFIRAFRKHVWKHRCMNTVEWERSQYYTSRQTICYKIRSHLSSDQI